MDIGAVNWIDVLSRIVHITTAVVLVGGSVFTVFVLMPAAEQLNQAEHDRLRSLVNGRWKKFVHLGILLFLVTGFYNYFRQMPNHKGDGLYHALIGTKILIALGLFFIASVLVGRSAAFEAWRNQRGKWLKVMVLLAGIIIAMSGFVKVRGTKGHTAAPASQTGTSQTHQLDNSGHLDTVIAPVVSVGSQP